MSIRRIRVVVVDHDGGELTLRCIESVRATVWDGELDIVQLTAIVWAWMDWSGRLPEP